MHQLIGIFGILGPLLNSGLTAPSVAGEPSRTAFMYQGQLKHDGIPVNETCDFHFTLWNLPTSNPAAITIGSPIEFSSDPGTNDPISVVNGLFTAQLDFGAGAFAGEPRYLAVAVSCPTGPLNPTYSSLGDELISPSPHAMYSLATRGLAVDENERVGIGTSDPLSDMHVVGATRLDGLLNVDLGTLFVDSGFNRVGIGTLGPNASLDVAGDVEMDGPTFVLDASNNHVGIGTFTPTEALSVVGVVEVTNDSSELGKVRITRPGGDPGLVVIADGGNRRDIRFTDLGVEILASPSNNAPGAFNGINVNEGGHVGIGAAAIDFARLWVVQSDGPAGWFSATNDIPLVVQRSGSDGTIVSFRNGAFPAGGISVSGLTVSYNAFTGSHYGWTACAPQPGTLVTMNGDNRHLHHDENAEIIYGFAPSTKPNDTACLGSYLGPRIDGDHKVPNDLHLVAAVGNGDMWVVESTRNLVPGDLLISSDVRGHAMLDDDSRFPVGHIVARVAESVDWSTVSDTVGGKKHRKISVFFDSFQRVSNTAVHRRLDAQRREISILKSELAALRETVEAIARSRRTYSTNLVASLSSVNDAKRTSKSESN